MLVALLLLAACAKKAEEPVVVNLPPNSGTKWQYRATEYDDKGTIVNRFYPNYTNQSTFLDSGVIFTMREDSTGENLLRLLQKKEGYYAVYDDTMVLMFKYPGTTGNTYEVPRQDGSVVTWKIIDNDAHLNVPFGTQQDCYFYEVYDNTGFKIAEWVFSKEKWVVRMMTFDQTPIGSYTHEVYELNKYIP